MVAGPAGLVVAGLSAAREKVVVVRDVSLDVPPGKVTLLLGPNGAGKTTVLDAVSGVIPPVAGALTLGGRNLAGMSRRARATAGVAYVEQGRTVFGTLTVRENLQVGARSLRAGPAAVDAAVALFPQLERRLAVPAGLVSGGEQQMVVLARALAGEPRLLLLDEMSLGLAPYLVERLLVVVRRLADQGTAVLLVEQFATMALPIADHALVLAAGRTTYSGPPATLRADPQLLHEAYLGTVAKCGRRTGA